MIKPAPWKIVVVCLFMIAIVGVGVLVLVSVMDTEPTDMGDGKPDQRRAMSTAPTFVQLTAPAQATTQSNNAADSYQQAFVLMHQMKASPADIILFDQYDAKNRFDDRAAEFFERYTMIASWVRRGATMSSVDWGRSSVAERMPVLNDSRAVALFMMMRARYETQTNDNLAATDDLIATMSFARHVGARALLVDQLVSVAIEQRVIDQLTPLLPSLPKQRVLWLEKQLDELPALVSGKLRMQAEYDAAIQTAQQQNIPTQIDALKSMQDFFLAIGDAIDRSPDSVDQAIDEQLAKLPDGSVARLQAKILAPSLKRAQATIIGMEAKRKALRDSVASLSR